MNEIILELAKQADPDHWHSRWYSGINPRVMDPEIKKFVELIVRECAVVADQWVDDEDNGHNLVSTKLKEHFGVEE